MTPRPGPYLAAMTAAVAVGLALSYWTGRPSPLAPRQRLAVWLGGFFGAMLGGRLLSLVIGAPGVGLLDGGRTILGGLVGGYLGVEFAKILAGVRVKTGDALCVPAAAAIAVGRLGCWFGRCCYGAPTTVPWAVDFGDGVPRHPTQLYELAFHAGAAAVLLALRRRGLLRFQLMKLYVLSYLAFRFLTEYIRPEPRLAIGLTGYQVAAAAFIPLFAALWAVDASAARRDLLQSPS